MNPLETSISHLAGRFEELLLQEVQSWDEWPSILLEAATHSLFGGGKRVRPVVSMMVCEAFGCDIVDVRAWACAIEMIHTYSLIHDDLPSMDDDAIRRGRPTCHVKYGEANAILAGDALLTEAFGVLAREKFSPAVGARLIALLARSSGGSGMVGGQIYDIQGELNDLASIRHMQSLKTGALIRASAQGAAISINRSPDEVDALAQYGSSLGALFQLTDDILDRTEDREADGNNLFHHLSESDVYALRDATASQAISALKGLNANCEPLIHFVQYISKRTI